MTIGIQKWLRIAIRKKVPNKRYTTTLPLKTAEYMNISFTSIIGPKTRKANFAAIENAAIGAAMNASDVLHKERMKPRPMIDGTATISLPATVFKIA